MEPWLAAPPRKWWRFMTPWNPLPFDVPTMSTRPPTSNSDTRRRPPTAGSSPPVRSRNSSSLRVGGTPALSKCPFMALLRFLTLTGSTRPICTASYPSRFLSRRCTTTHGPTWSTVQGTTRPSSSNTCVMAIFRPISPSTTMPSAPFLLERLDFDFDARRQIELHQRVHRLRGRVEDVQEPLVGANLELLARLLVDVRRAVHGVLVDPRRERDRTGHPRARALGRRHDLRGRLVEDPVIVGFQADANLFVEHLPRPDPPLGDDLGDG